MEVKSFLHNNHGSDPEELKLSLYIGENTSKKGDSSRTWYNRETCLVTRDVIDLEESLESVSTETARPVSSLTLEAPTNFVGMHRAQIPVLSDSSFSKMMRKDPGHGLFTSRSLADHSGSFQEENLSSLYTGLGEYHASIPLVGLCTRKQQSSAYNTTLVNLNRVQLDEFSCFSKDPFVIQGVADKSSKGTKTLATWRKPNNSCSSEFSDVRQQDNAAYSALMDTRGKYCSKQFWVTRTKFNENSRSEEGDIDLDSLPKVLVDLFKDISNQAIKHSKANMDLLLGLPNNFLSEDDQTSTSIVNPSSKIVGKHFHTYSAGTDLTQTAGDAEIGQVNCGKSEETLSLSSFQSHVVVKARHCIESPAACNSDSDADNNWGGVTDLKSGTGDKHEMEFPIFLHLESL
ncbi:hypothetical protein HHK36_028689 [Tetracentron sinense]|uniref:Uncharacterized protein n=1 Tax=Tetracentron sinense TaxID=13715 RepID=A0A835D0P2_TETSI|nr:hypothetical protein HHK36_028689 [Tetracentron sinense]